MMMGKSMLMKNQKISALLSKPVQETLFSCLCLALSTLLNFAQDNWLESIRTHIFSSKNSLLSMTLGLNQWNWRKNLLKNTQILEGLINKSNSLDRPSYYLSLIRKNSKILE